MRATTDGITAEIIRNRLESITEEMGIVLMRTSRSPILSETHDFSTAIFDAKGRMIAQSPHSLSHLLSMKFSTESALDRFSFDLQHEDVIITNDPYLGGTHLPDMTMFTPVFHADEIVLFPANRVHHGDIGGVQPGGLYPLAHELYQEGDIITPVRLAKAGKLHKDILRRLLKNNRRPNFYRADLNAMIAANRVGQTRIDDLVREYGADTLVAAVDYILGYTEKLFRAELSRWPKGTYEGRSYLDSDFKGNQDLMVRVKVTVGDGELTVDFTGSSPQTIGFVNSPLANTKTAVFIPILCLVDETIPKNEGLLKPVKFIAPEGSIVNPTFPAATGFSTLHIGGQISEAVARALSQALPEKVGTTWANLPQVVIVGEIGAEDRFINQATVAVGGCGATFGVDGWGWPAPFGRVNVSSVDMLEVQYSQFVEEREIVTDSGGAGKWRGGPGTRVVLRIRDQDPEVTAFTAGIKYPSAGFEGGCPGLPNSIHLKLGSPGEAIVDPLVFRLPMRSGERIDIQQGGGGGWGNPLEREVERVLQDVIDGYVSVEAAERMYGVVFDPSSMQPDDDKTRLLRQSMARNVDVAEDKVWQPSTR